MRLDVVVTDPEGKVVRDLTQQDFEVREDGKPQRIRHFVLAGRSATGLAPGPEAAAPPAAPVPLAGAPHRHRLRRPPRLRQQPPLRPGRAARFVREFTSADDTVALLTTSAGGVLQQLTRDRAALEQAVGSLTSRDVTVGRDRGGRC